MTNLNQAVTGVSTEQEARALLLSAGITAMQNRAALVPLVTDAPLFETEAAFSERTKSERKTRDIRIKQWIQHINRFTYTDNPTLLSFDDMKQIEFITYKHYLLFVPMDDFLEAIEKETESLPWLERVDNE